MRLQAKSSIITGAASGIGREIAHAYAREGANVAIGDLDEAGAKAVADEITQAGGQALGLRMDVTDGHGRNGRAGQQRTAEPPLARQTTVQGRDLPRQNLAVEATTAGFLAVGDESMLIAGPSTCPSSSTVPCSHHGLPHLILRGPQASRGRYSSLLVRWARQGEPYWGSPDASMGGVRPPP